MVWIQEGGPVDPGRTAVDPGRTAVDLGRWADKEARGKLEKKN